MGSSVTVAIAIGCATPGPDTFKAANVQNTSLETISACVKGKLEFDSEIGADSALVDFRQGLIGGKDARRARIEPERRSFRLTAQQAAQGRIIARIRSDDTIPSLGLGPWWTWWWVDSIGTGGWRSVFIPENGKPPYHVPPGPRPRGPLHLGARAGPGRHGDGVPRHRHEARAPGGDQAAGARHARLPRE